MFIQADQLFQQRLAASSAGEKWRISLEQGKLCSDWWFVDPSDSQVHNQGKVDAPGKGSKLHCPKVDAPLLTTTLSSG